MLTNPSFSQAELATFRVPDFKVASAAVLAEAYEHTKHMPVKPWKHGADDDMRDCLDQAATRTTGIDIGTIRCWRARISCEPTVTSKNVVE